MNERRVPVELGDYEKIVTACMELWEASVWEQHGDLLDPEGAAPEARGGLVAGGPAADGSGIGPAVSNARTRVLVAARDLMNNAMKEELVRRKLEEEGDA